MRLAEAFASATLDDIKAALDGGKLVLYSTGRPVGPDHVITRSEALATFTFASPAFNGDAPSFAEATVIATAIGTPGWARLSKADGTPVADLSAGPGATEIKLASVSATKDFPVTVTSVTFGPAETVEWAKTEFGHVFQTNHDNPFRKVSVRG
ncbi:MULTISPECIES: hypothetical protein [Methylosinus]|uniref:Uncharacterized protein n=1 Tax=Methylosinus trichosporium (strain ATCC 35070 / NCIMB 11131 / UNIQEM 75 / OB3b) TaxID=595536 RepID=A0A2D2CXU8_METT3|nr:MULTISPECIES: hypothetical protein [Methylosinus]ATQ67553.1 hypothetical protein CQW49_06370 [Methylosinus trichosporium OB3b]OBS50788.1 hypothetical protein A8B73_19695 [Methylosinus sp. 3S-1]